jgi:formylglycine-generating enzyme required for sulfatase activity
MKKACSALFILMVAVMFGITSLSCKRHRGESSSARTTQDGTTADGKLFPDLRFVQIPAGSFDMGSDSAKAFDQNPVHQVTITRAFELQTTEVTQAQWVAVMGSNPSHFKGDDLPVDSVSWNDAQEFIGKLNALDPEKNYRLPTEAEWEYACRAGSKDARYGDLDAIAWWTHNSGQQTHAVGQKQPNAWGLYDMLGNVWELCADWKDSYPVRSVTDPTGPSSGYYRVSRGGGWFDAASAVHATFRSSPEPTYRGSSLGFRLARGPV